MKNATLQELSSMIAHSTNNDIINKIDAMLSTETGVHWIRDLTKLKSVITNQSPQFSIIAESGNIKLPFLSFSALPGADNCPGAGDCLKYCYSFKAQRYPAAYCRQAQNSLLLKTKRGRSHILKALDKAVSKQHKKTGLNVDFRLYVDGDFSTLSDVTFWFTALKSRPTISAYGYSKSFDLILKYGSHLSYPGNYVLNISSGSNASQETIERVKRLPITRGEFIAVPMAKIIKTSDHNDRKHQAELRKVFGKKAFTCPGQCGSCTKSMHACGSHRFDNIPVIIGVH